MSAHPTGSRLGAAFSVIVPAHNEERSIGRTLDSLLRGLAPYEADIVVVCNGCTDRTAAIAGTYQPQVTVLDLPQPSKNEALHAGDAASRVFPRIYVDADVEIAGSSLKRLVKAMERLGVDAAAPVRVIPRTGVARTVRWFYDVWEELPQVRAGLFGRGVIAVTRQGFEKLQSLPDMMSDDFSFSEALAGSQSVVTEAEVTIRPPRTVHDLLRRRVRVMTGMAQADDAGTRKQASKTSFVVLVQLARRQPRLVPRIVVFVSVGMAAKVMSRRAVRRGDFHTWLRDDSSRA